MAEFSRCLALRCLFMIRRCAEATDFFDVLFPEAKAVHRLVDAHAGEHGAVCVGEHGPVC